MNPSQTWNISLKNSNSILKRQHLCRAAFLKQCCFLVEQLFAMKRKLPFLKAELIQCLEIYRVSKEQYAACLPLQKCCISLWCRDFSQKEVALLGGKIQTSWPPGNQKCCFLLFTPAFKTCNIEANTTLSFEHGATGQNWIKLSLIFIGSIQYFISNTLYYSILFSDWIFPAVTMGLVSGPSTLFLLDVQAIASSAMTTASKIS